MTEKRDLVIDNKARIEAEWNDLLGALANLENDGIELTPNIEAITKKIQTYTAYSETLGTVKP